MFGKQGRIQSGAGVRDSVESSFDYLFWIFDKFGTFYLILLLNKSILLPVKVRKIAGWVANSVDPDQTPRFALFVQACLSEYVEYVR